MRATICALLAALALAACSTGGEVTYQRPPGVEWSRGSSH